MPDPLEDMTSDDFDEVEEAVMQTQRGRWFLREFAHRRCAGENAKVLAAIEKLDTRLYTRESGAIEARRIVALRLGEVLETLHSAQAKAAPAGDASPREPDRATAPARAREDARRLVRHKVSLRELDALEVGSKLRLFG